MGRAQTDTEAVLSRVRPDERLPIVDPLCGEASEPTEVLSANGFRIMRCQRCGIAWSDPHLADSALARLVYTNAHVAETWKKPRRRPLASRVWRAVRGAFVPIDHLEKRWAVIRRWLPTGEPLEVLEIGCWTGDLMRLAAARAPEWRLRGLEPYPFARQRAQAAGLNVQAGFLEGSDLPDDSIGGLVAWNVLEHTRNPVTFLQAARRVLRPGGRCLLHLPNYGSVAARLRGARWSALKPEQHRWHLSHDALRRVLGAAEAEVVHLHSLWGNIGSQTLAVVRWN